MNQDLSKLIARSTVGEQIQSHVVIDGIEVHFKFWRGPRDNAPLVVRFHGAIQRDKRPLPAFQENLRKFSGSAHQLTICDPTMTSREGFSCAWFTGHDALDTQALLSGFIDTVLETLSPSRTIYLGSSSGGFAALYFSHRHPGSIAVVMVPQTSLERHFIRVPVDRYLKHCWPGLTLAEVASRVCTDVCELYADKFQNTVIYIQSQGDFRHNALQLQPFMAACLSTGNPENEKLILVSDYWGVPGHAGAVPPGGYLSWVEAAISSPDTELTSLLQTHHALSGKAATGGPTTRRPSRSANDHGFADADVRMAGVVTGNLLRVGDNHEDKV